MILNEVPRKIAATAEDMFIKNYHPCCKLKNLQKFFLDRLIEIRVISKKIGENLCINGRTRVRRLKLI